MKNSISKAKSWFEFGAGFFDKDYLDDYKYLTPELTKMQVDFMEKALNLKPGQKIFDLPCGYGRHSIELAKRGYDVTGQDLNSYFIKMAKQNAKLEKVKARFVEQDMRRVDFEKEFDVALNLFTSFGYFDDWRDDELVLNNIAKSLKKGGLFLFDMLNRDRVLREFQSKRWENNDDHILLIELKFDLLSGRTHDNRTRIYEDGKKKMFHAITRMYSLSELARMMERASFEVTASYGDYAGGTASLTSQRSILVGKKL